MGFSSLRNELPEFRRNALEVIGSCRIDRHRNGSDSRPLCDRHRDRRGVGMEELLRRIIAQGRKELYDCKSVFHSTPRVFEKRSDNASRSDESS